MEGSRDWPRGMALAAAKLGVQAIFWFLERSPGTSRPSGLCPDVTPSGPLCLLQLEEAQPLSPLLRSW